MAVYNLSLNIARNFMFMTPELAGTMHDSILTKVQDALNEYDNIAPCWFITKYYAGAGETTLQQPYDSLRYSRLGQ